jgi:uncharacterized membrane protein (DUF106 family)
VAPFWVCLLTSALLGFFINLSSNLVIQVRTLPKRKQK